MFFTCIILLVGIEAVKCQRDTIAATLANIPEDGLLNFTQLAAKYGYQAVTYSVTTDDGYLLDLFNIPGNRNNPVMFAHGIFDTADGWLLRGNTSLAVMVAQKGYDVWLMNFRGNRYARRHLTLDPNKDERFWDFSVHEYATYDMSACIDFVLNFTGREQLSIIGFSEGTTATAVLGSTQPEYNDKVNIFIALAPVVYLENAGFLLGVIINFSPILNIFLPQGIQEVVGYYSLMKSIINLLCTQLVIGYELCYQGGINAVSGANSLGIDRKFLPIVIGHFPAGTSRKNLLHFAQIGLRQSFAQYDYGASKNLKMYHSFTPPTYDITKMTMKTVLVSGKNDAVSTMKDVEILKGKLRNLEGSIVIERDTYNHLDHLWAKDAYILEYPLVMDALAKYNRD